MKLTPSQTQAVTTLETNLLVSAGAGTGKTRVLVERFLYLITQHEILPTEILALTFTEKAAAEMKSRILLRLNELWLWSKRQDLESAYISTFHSFASRLLKEHPLEAGVDPDFKVLEAEESELWLEAAMDEAIEKGCYEEEQVLELLKFMGEKNIRSGIAKVIHAARTHGKSLDEFFNMSSPQTKMGTVLFFNDELKNRTVPIFDQVGKGDLAKEWKAWIQSGEWDWDQVEEFKLWFKPFSRRGGKKDKHLWQEITQNCRDLLAFKLEELTQPWRERFEALAKAVEEIYEKRKLEESYLDFDDLQMKAVSLFKKEAVQNQILRRHYQKLFRHLLVDEFQDTNPLQWEFVTLLAGEDNLFCVGDFKQSIYGFRGTSPKHFSELEANYKQEEGGLRIALSENFRSQKSVLDFVNGFFERLWQEDDFSPEPLIAATEAERQEETAVELLMIEAKEDHNAEQSRLQEARQLASHLKTLHENGIAYGDMAILFQAMTSSGLYEQALKELEIPYFVVAGRGFYHQPEIRDMLSFLECLENPLSDIALAASLRSPLFQIKDDTLFWLTHAVKAEDETTPLFSALEKISEISEIPENEKKKLQHFQEIFQELLKDKDAYRLAELLDQILRLTAYELHVLHDSQGIRRYSNLMKLIDLARSYEMRERMSIGQFIRTIRTLETREVRESEAQIGSEQGGRVVRLMTIHAAKGLEFSVVALADLAREKRSPDSKAFLAAGDRGYGFVLPNTKTLEMEKPQAWLQLDNARKQQEREEWKRLFYVAMTRAKDYLILSGVARKRKTQKETFSEMSSWMDWVMSLKDELGLQRVKPKVSLPKGTKPLIRKKAFRTLLHAPDSALPESPEVDSLEETIERLSQPMEAKSRVIDLSVTEYVKYSMPVSAIESEPKKDSELEPGTDGTGTEVEVMDFGTRVHRVLELLDFKAPNSDLKSLIDDVFRSAAAESKKLALTYIEKFIQSQCFQNIQNAKRVYRELPFILNERHGKIYGVIDLLYEDAAGWHVVDYKTGMGDEAKIKKMGYDTQIGIYSHAVYKIMGVLPDSASLYFLGNDWEYKTQLDNQAVTTFAKELEQQQSQRLESL